MIKIYTIEIYGYINDNQKLCADISSPIEGVFFNTSKHNEDKIIADSSIALPASVKTKTIGNMLYGFSSKKYYI